MSEEQANGEDMQQLVDDDVIPEWMHVLLRTRFWEPCSKGHKENRADDCMFCLHCYEVFCPHCSHNKPGHRLLKIRRYVYRSVVLAKDMQELNVDVSRIQTYVINGQKGVHLRPIRRAPSFRPSADAPPCKTCGCWLRNAPHLFCSLTCKEEDDVSQDDFSGPEAERRYRNTQPNMAQQAETEEQRQPAAEPDQHGAVAEPAAALEQAESSLVANALGLLKENKRSYRTRPRKQEKPQRAPFY